MGWAALLDDWADRGISGGLCRRPVARHPLRSEAGEHGRLAQDGFHRRGGGCHPLLHHLLGARSPEGCDLLPLWSESHAVLGLRRGLHARSLSWHLGTLGARRSDGVGRLPPGDLTHGDCRRGGAAAVLLPAPARRMASRKAGALSEGLGIGRGATTLLTPNQIEVSRVDEDAGPFAEDGDGIQAVESIGQERQPPTNGEEPERYGDYALLSLLGGD